MVMTGGASVSCPRTFVFFRLMVSPKSSQACEKQSINDEFLLDVGRNFCVISKHYVLDENLAYLCISSEMGEMDEVEEPAM